MHYYKTSQLAKENFLANQPSAIKTKSNMSNIGKHFQNAQEEFETRARSNSNVIDKIKQTAHDVPKTIIDTTNNRSPNLTI